MERSKKAVTIKDIATQLNVSLSTVNKALTGKSGISELRREEVVFTARELGYSVNHTAQALSRHTLHIGVIIPAIWRQFWADVECGMIQEFGRLKHFNVSGIFEYAHTIVDTERAFYKLIDAGMDALIFCPSLFLLSEDLINAVRNSGIPLFISGGEYQSLDAVCTIAVNGALSGCMAADIMRLTLPSGAEVAVLTGSIKSQIHAAKVNAFATSVSQSGRHMVGIYATRDDEDIAAGCINKLYRDYPSVRGVYIASATAAPMLAFAAGLPADQRPVIVGTDIYDDMCAAIQAGVAVGTIYQNQLLMGRISVRQAYNYLVARNSYQAVATKVGKRIYVDPQLYLASNVENLSSKEEKARPIID